MIFVSLQQHCTSNELIIICIFSVYTVYLVRHESKGLILFSFPLLGTCLLPWKHSFQAWSFFPTIYIKHTGWGTDLYLNFSVADHRGVGKLFLHFLVDLGHESIRTSPCHCKKGCSEFQSAEPLRLESVRGPFSTGCGNLPLTTS